MKLNIPHKQIKTILEWLGVVDIFLVKDREAAEEFEERDIQDRCLKPNGDPYKYFCEISWGCGPMDDPPSEYQLKHAHVFNGVDFALCDGGSSPEDCVEKCLRNLLKSAFDPENDWHAARDVLIRAGVSKQELADMIQTINPIDVSDCW